MSYPIADIFYSLQGEGHFVGYPMVFVRLAGCSVQKCHIRAECDEAPWKMRERLSTEEIVQRIDYMHRLNGTIVCITGGEPTDHDLVQLVGALHDMGCRIHMETSGVRPVVGYPLEWLTVSPKTMTYVQRTGHALKIVVRPEWTDEEAWASVDQLDEDTEFFHRYLQPLTVSGEARNTAQVTRMLLDGRNAGGRWALSTQAHRTWELP
jgi:organic radical activating enzyme